jgi:diketogulonate reductase-like aldo/keto reductase
VPLVGLGSWITFNVGNDAVARERLHRGHARLLRGGGRLIDSSPMYGSSQPVIGHGLASWRRSRPAVSAEKVWIGDGAAGGADRGLARFWGVPRFDLLQVHNLLAWEEHLPRPAGDEGGGPLRYVGITTSEGRRHAEIEQVMRSQPIDFVQLSYNLLDREAEQRILPLAPSAASR